MVDNIDGQKIANLVDCPTDRAASNPPVSFGGSFLNNSGTGIYGSLTAMGHSIAGTDIMSLSATLCTLSVSLSLSNDIVILKRAGVPVDGTSGTGAGISGPGSICVDYTNANLYVNGNTKASPTWKLVTRAA